MGNELLKIWEQDKKTALFVTHSIDEAIFLGDRVVVMTKVPAESSRRFGSTFRARERSRCWMAGVIDYRRRIRAHLMDGMQKSRAQSWLPMA